MRPPVEEGVAADEFGLPEQLLTAPGLFEFEVFERIEVTIGQHLVRERPQPLGRLQFRTVGRQKDEGETLRHLNFVTAMPTRLI